MINSIKFISIFLLFASCKSPSDKIKDVILDNDSVGYWNYEWPRELLITALLLNLSKTVRCPNIYTIKLKINGGCFLIMG